MIGARCLGLVAAALALSTPVAALEGERELSVAVIAGPSDPWYVLGVAAGIDAQQLWHTSDFWAFGLGIRPRVASRPTTVSVAAEGIARWTLDALQWIPSVAVGIGYQLEASQLRSSTGPVGRLEASLAWRQQRERAWVFRLQAESAQTVSPDYFRVLIGLGLVWYSGKGAALDL